MEERYGQLAEPEMDGDELGALERLEGGCGVVGLDGNDTYLYKAIDSKYSGMGVEAGDTIIFARNLEPKVGALCIFEYDGQIQPVLLL